MEEKKDIEINYTFTPEEVNTILQGLGHIALMQSGPLFERIRNHAIEVLKENEMPE